MVTKCASPLTIHPWPITRACLGQFGVFICLPSGLCSGGSARWQYPRARPPSKKLPRGLPRHIIPTWSSGVAITCPSEAAAENLHMFSMGVLLYEQYAKPEERIATMGRYASTCVSQSGAVYLLIVNHIEGGNGKTGGNWQPSIRKNLKFDWWMAPMLGYKSSTLYEGSVHLCGVGVSLGVGRHFVFPTSPRPFFCLLIVHSDKYCVACFFGPSRRIIFVKTNSIFSVWVTPPIVIFNFKFIERG